MIKGIKQSNQIKPAGQEECIYSDDLFVTELPIWYQKNGKVNPVWLSICKEERNQTKNIEITFKETAVHVSTYGWCERAGK